MYSRAELRQLLRDAHALENIGTVHLQRGNIAAATSAFRQVLSEGLRDTFKHGVVSEPRSGAGGRFSFSNISTASTGYCDHKLFSRHVAAAIASTLVLQILPTNHTDTSRFKRFGF